MCVCVCPCPGASAVWRADRDHSPRHPRHQAPGAAAGRRLLSLLRPAPRQAGQHGAGGQASERLAPRQPEAPAARVLVRNAARPFLSQPATGPAGEERRAGNEEERGARQEGHQEPEGLSRRGVRGDAVSCPQALHCRGAQGTHCVFIFVLQITPNLVETDTA